MLLEVMLVATEVAWAEQERRQSDHTLRLSVPTMDLKYGHMRLPTLCLPTLQLEDRSLLPVDRRATHSMGYAEAHCTQALRSNPAGTSLIGVPHYWHQLSRCVEITHAQLQANAAKVVVILPDALRMPVAALPTRSTT